MRKSLPILCQSFTALGFGLAVSGFALFVGWKHASQGPSLNKEQRYTQMQLELINDAITDYRERFGRLPSSLLELASRNHSLMGNEGESVLDGWGRPIRYREDGQEVFVVSYGRDGKAGGLGLDFDLTDKNIWPEQANPTFSQFILEMPSGSLVIVCLVCGAATGLVLFIAVGSNLECPFSFKHVIAYLVFTVCAMICAGEIVLGLLRGA